MKDKFNMTREDMLFWAKRNVIDYIWKSANLEGISATYPDTELIFEGLVPQGFAVRDILSINNLKRAWYFISEHLDIEIDYILICHINGIIGGDDLIRKAGTLRGFPVRIGGTSWMPELPKEEQVKEEIKSIINTYATPTEQAIELMLYCMRAQLFNDGNKRTAMMVANLLMMSKGVGVVSIPIEHQEEFRRKLVDYYETADKSSIKQFVYDYCIDGFDFGEE